MELTGRSDETRRIDALLRSARDGTGGALVLRGEAGIGKSALLEHARERATGFRVIRAAGSEFETALPYAAVQQVTAPVLADLPAVPEPQRHALQVALGLTSGAPNPLWIGLAALRLLTAGDEPVLCLVDDAQWLDPASSAALAFVARRVAAEPVAVVFAVRTHLAPDGGGAAHDTGDLADLPTLTVQGLGDTAARALLAARSHTTLDDQVRDRVVAEARGNPLALRELPRAGGFVLPDPAPVPTRVERNYRARFDALPPAARSLLTIASADPTGDPAVVWAAAHDLDLDVDAATAAATATGLADFETRVRFCHPLARSAVYRHASADLRRTAHGALAAVTDPHTDPDRRAWHRAHAVAGPAEDVAADLERAATHARARGGVAAAAAFLERAAALSRDPGRRADRTLEAAQAHLDAGGTDAAADLLATVGHVADAARLDLLRGHVAFRRRDDGDGTRFMLRAARHLADTDPHRSREFVIETIETGLVVGRATGVTDLALAVAPGAASPQRAPDVLDGLTLLARDGPRAAAPVLRRVLDGDGTPLWTRRPALATLLAGQLWDPDAHAAIAGWLVKEGRSSGAPLVLRLGLAQTAFHATLTGELDAATAAIVEEEALADATGGPPVVYHRLLLAAVRGQRTRTRELIRAATADDGAAGPGQLPANLHLAAAILHNGVGDYPAALAAARRATERNEVFLAGFALPELVEAAVRSGEPAEAAAALEPLTEQTAAAGTATGLGVAAYARGLVNGAEDDYLAAIEHLEQSPLLPWRGRAHLLYGEWLRREGRRLDCRRQLGVAHELFSAHGIDAFARRAADELRATGERARRRARDDSEPLTMQELFIAREVATGATSQEVATRLYLSPRTIDAHLRNIFRKLGLTSRRQLRDHPALRAGRDRA